MALKLLFLATDKTNTFKLTMNRPRYVVTTRFHTIFVASHEFAVTETVAMPAVFQLILQNNTLAILD